VTPRPRDPIEEARKQWERHGWAAAADGMAMVTSVVRVQQLLMERIDTVLRPLDLTFARYEVLQLLSFVHSGRMSMTRLGSLLQVHPTSVSSAVDRLVKQGHVERLRGEDDKRVILASLTTSGRAIVDRATDGLNQSVFEAPGIPAEDVTRLTALLGRVRASAGDHVASLSDLA
jgi:DNA-binding MarR family transcriptional regulator